MLMDRIPWKEHSFQTLYLRINFINFLKVIYQKDDRLRVKSTYFSNDVFSLFFV